MKPVVFIGLFFWISSFSVAQKAVLNLIHIKNFVGVNGKGVDSIYQEFTVDSEGFMQGAFRNYYKNSGKYIAKGSYKNNMLVDSCFWYDKDGVLFAKGNFTYKEDYRRMVGLNVYSPEKNYYAYLNDTLLIYNHPRTALPSVLTFKDNLKHGVCYIISKDGFINTFTYRQDTLHGYFKNMFFLNGKLFLKIGAHWNGDNSYDGWYHKYLVDYKDSVLIEKTLYDKNRKQLSSIFYESGKPACNYYYSTPGILDSVRCMYEEGTTKSFVQYDQNREGTRFSYSNTGQVIEQAACKNGHLHGYAFEYSGSDKVQTKKLYRNDTIITKEQIQNNIVWQRVFYKNGEVEKVDWFDHRGNYKSTTCCESAGNAYWGPNGNPPIGFTPSYKQTTHTEYHPEKDVDLLLFKPLPENEGYRNGGYANAFIISKLENKFQGSDHFYKNLLYSIQDSLTAFAQTKNGAVLTKLKAPVNIVCSLSLMVADSQKGFVLVHLTSIDGVVNKKIKTAIEKFFAYRTVPYTYPFHANSYLECHYTISPK